MRLPRRQNSKVNSKVSFHSPLKFFDDPETQWAPMVKQLLQDFFDATTGDVFAQKTKITKELYCEKIAKIHIKAIALKGFLLKHL